MSDFNIDRLNGPPSVFAMRDAKREIERLRSDLSLLGPVTTPTGGLTCASCIRDVSPNWTYCPYCGSQERNDYSFTPQDGGMRARISGRGSGIEVGDFLLLTNRDRAEDRATRYQITKIEYMTNPHDQWFADAIFAPRSSG